MSKNAMDMNFLVGKSYTYLKRLLGDQVSIPGDFILSNQSGQQSTSTEVESQEEFVSIKSTAAQVGSSQITANGKVLVDIEQYDMTPTFSTEKVKGTPLEQTVKMSSPTLPTPLPTPVTTDGPTKDGPTKDGPTTDGPTKDGPTKDGPTKDDLTKEPEVVPTEAPLPPVEESTVEQSKETLPEAEPLSKEEVKKPTETPVVDKIKEIPTKPTSNGSQGPPQLALSKDIIKKQLEGLKPTGIPLTGGGEIIYP
jgi:hypothetical protein